jgi:hypothetical protein
MTNPGTSFSIMAATPGASAKSSGYLRQWEGQMSVGRVTVTVGLPPYTGATRDVTA